MLDSYDISTANLAKDDLSDVIINISPKDTPVLTMFGTTGASQVFHEWTEKDTSYNGEANAKVEGFSYEVEDFDLAERIGNYCQIMGRGYQATDTSEVIGNYGGENLAVAMVEAHEKLAKDMEYALLNNASRSAGSKTTARQTGGLPYWVVTNVLSNSGTDRLFSETILADAQEDIWDQGGDAGDCVLSGGQKRKMSSWFSGVTRYITMDEASYKQKVEVFESEFGILRFTIDRYIGNAEVYVLDRNRFKIAWLRKFKELTLPKSSDAEKRYVVGEWAFEAQAEQSSARITDLALTVS